MAEALTFNGPRTLDTGATETGQTVVSAANPLPTAAVGITIANALTVTASSAYASGNVLGGLITITGAALAAGRTGLIQKVVINSKSAQTAQVDVLLFNANPTGSTFTDKAAVAVAVGDFSKLLGVVHVTDWTNTGTTSVGVASGLAMPYACIGSTTLYAVAVTRGTPTFTATTDLSAAVDLIQN